MDRPADRADPLVAGREPDHPLDVGGPVLRQRPLVEGLDGLRPGDHFGPLLRPLERRGRLDADALHQLTGGGMLSPWRNPRLTCPGFLQVTHRSPA